MAAQASGKLADPTAPNDPAVLAAFHAVPDAKRAEIVDGQLHVRPWQGRAHAIAASVLGGALYEPFWRGRGGPGGWTILHKPAIYLGPKPDIVVPDLAGWRCQRMPMDGREDEQHYRRVAPDWVCEVLSPGTEALDRAKKMRIYRREGVAHVWLIKPTIRTLELYRLEDGRWVFLDCHENDAFVRAEPFDANELSMAVLWEG